MLRKNKASVCVSYNKLSKMSIQEISDKYGDFVKETYMALQILKGTNTYKDVFKELNGRKYNLEIFYCNSLKEDVTSILGDNNTVMMQYDHRKASIGLFTNEIGVRTTVAMPALSSILHESVEVLKCNIQYNEKGNEFRLYEDKIENGPDISDSGFDKFDSWNGQSDNFVMEIYETNLARELYGLPKDEYYRNRHGGIIDYETECATSIQPTKNGKMQIRNFLESLGNK